MATQLPNVLFDKEAHTYEVDGERLPSVTQVLNQWKRLTVGGSDYFFDNLNGVCVPAGMFEGAGEFGTKAHTGCAAIAEGNPVIWGAGDSRLDNIFTAFMVWMEDFKVKPIAIETPIYSPKLLVAGTPDLVCDLTRNNKEELAIVDYKTGSGKALSGPQIAGYKILEVDFHGTRKKINRYELRLSGDHEDYKFTPLTNPQDQSFFLNRLYQYRYLQNGGAK